MKVLEKGNGWNMQVECTGKGHGSCGCGAKLLIEKDDVYLTNCYDFDGKMYTFYTIQCIQCGEETNIDENLIPVGIYCKALKKSFVII